MPAIKMALGSAVSAAVSAASPLATPAEHSKAHIIKMVRGTSGVATRAWACECVGTPARGPPFSPLRKVLRARLRGRDPSTGWAGPCAVKRTPSRVRRAPSATPTMNTARPSRARSSNDLRKLGTGAQLVILITRICAGRAGMRGSTIALTFKLCPEEFERHVVTLHSRKVAVEERRRARPAASAPFKGVSLTCRLCPLAPECAKSSSPASECLSLSPTCEQRRRLQMKMASGQRLQVLHTCL